MLVQEFHPTAHCRNYALQQATRMAQKYYMVQLIPVYQFVYFSPSLHSQLPC